METYEKIIRDYKLNRLDLYTDDIGMEARINLNGSINTKGGISGIADTDIIKRIEQVIAKILTIIENAIMTISTTMKRALETNIGFERRLKEMRANHRPIKNAIKVSIYSYNIGQLEQARNAVTKVVLGLMQQSNDTSQLLYKTDEDKNVLLKGRSETELYIIKAVSMQLPSAKQAFDSELVGVGANIKGFMNYVKASFRGHKQNILVSGTDAPTYINIALSVKGVSDMVLNQIKIMKSSIDKLKAGLQSTRSNVVNPEEKRKLAVIANSLSAASNIYITFYRYYHNLRLEQAFAAREVVSRLYQFPSL